MEFRHRLRVRAFIALATVIQVVAIVFGVSILVQGAPATAAQTVPYKVNFQGRLSDSSGNVLSDGLYNVKFRLWTALSGGSNSWEADRVRGASDYRIQVTNGLFNIQFGDTALGDPAITPSLFNTGTGALYLEVELPTPATATCATNGCAVFTEGAMTPRQALASSPYAINSDSLDGLDSSAFGQIASSNTFTAANIFAPGASAVVALTVKASTGGANHSLDVVDSSNATQAYFDAAGKLNVSQTIQPTSNNTVDLGTSGAGFKTAYFSTSVVSAALNATAAGGTITTNAGTIQRTAAGTTTVDLVDGSDTTLAITNSGAGAANLTTDGSISIGSGKTYSVGASTGQSSTVSCGANQAVITATFTGGVLTTAPGCATMNGTGATTTLNNVGSTSIGAALLPATTFTYDLGATTNIWKNLYVSNVDAQSATNTTLTIGTTNATALTFGNATNTTTQSSVVKTGGTLNLGNNANDKTINIGATATTNNTSAVNIANTTSTGGASTVQIGGTGVTSGSNAGTTVTAQGGQTMLKVANGGVNVQTFTNSATAVQVNNLSNKQVLAVDTSGSQVVLGQAGPSGLDGKLVFNNAAAASSVSIVTGNTGTSYTLTLPTAVGNTNDCLKATNGTGTLGFGTCATSLQTAYDGSGAGQPKILLSSTLGGLSIQDGTTPVTGNIFAIQNNGATATYLGVTSSAVTFQDSAGNNAMVFDSTTSHLKIYENITTPVRYADVYYDNTNSEAVFAASSGITHVGNGSGNVTIPLTGQNDIFTFSKTYTPGASYVNNDFTISRALTAAGNTAGGAVAKIEDISSGTVIQPTILLLNENNAAATGSLIKGQLNGADKFTVGVAGSVTIAASQSYTGAGAVTLSSAAATALTLTGNAASTWATSAGQLTLQSGSGTLSFGSTTNLTAGGALTLDSNTTSALGIGTGANAKTVTIGNTTGATNVTLSSGTGGFNIGDDATTKTIDIGGNTNSGTDTINIATNSTAADTIAIGNANAGTKITLVAGASTTTSGTAGVIIGSATADTTQINLQLDSSSTFAETGSTCSTIVNQGAMYYNSTSNAVRTCVNGGWEDMVTTAGLGIIAFGVVADAGNNPGDGPGLVSAGVSGPCKVSWASATTYSIAPCTAYSGGRKVIVAQVTGAAVSGMTATSVWAHICLTGANGQPALSATATTENATANQPTWSANNPVLCLADILGTGTGQNISKIYDTRAFTNSTKEFVTIASTVPGLGQLVIGSGNSVTQATNGGSLTTVLGVLIALSSAGASATTPSGIMVTSGPQYVKATTTTGGQFLISTTTAGYASSAAAYSGTTSYGNVRTSATNTCAAAATCLDSVYVNFKGH